MLGVTSPVAYIETNSLTTAVLKGFVTETISDCTCIIKYSLDVFLLHLVCIKQPAVVVACEAERTGGVYSAPRHAPSLDAEKNVTWFRQSGLDPSNHRRATVGLLSRDRDSQKSQFV